MVGFFRRDFLNEELFSVNMTTGPGTLTFRLLDDAQVRLLNYYFTLCFTEGLYPPHFNINVSKYLTAY